jgi:hypothetical protein
MKKVSLFAASLGMLIGISAAIPAEAMPNTVPSVSRTTDVQNARVIVRYGYYRGHRGYRYRRPGYRMYNGFWYPSVAFGPAVIIAPRRNWGWCGRRPNRFRC